MINTDRYDDRDVISTNLIESYDRLMSFGQKHLNDTFHLDGIQSVSARDRILKEIISNLLAHRDFSSGYIAKMVIERKRIYTENGNLSHGHGVLNLATFDPFQKNPPISKVFREIGLADELGSGMRNTYKYTKMYSGGEPEFVEGDVFRIWVPLSEAATVTVGPDILNVNEKGNSMVRGVGEQDTPQDTPQDRSQRERDIIQFCTQPRDKKEIMQYLGLIDVKHFRKSYLKPLLDSGKLVMTIPDKPKSRYQKYMKT